MTPMAIFHYREKTLDDIMDPKLWKQIDPQSFNVFTQTAYDCLNEERSQRPDIGEVVTRLESALKLQMERQNAENSVVAAEVEVTSSNHDKGSLYSISTHVSKETKSFLKDLSHLKLTWKDIASATNNLAKENIISKFRFGSISKGRLLHSGQFINIIVKRFYFIYVKNESKKFWTEISMLSSLEHENLVSLVGFHENENIKVIIYKNEANRSLKTYLSDQTLTWMQRLKICVGVAKALSYIHYDPGRDFSVIHCNIRSSKILLDDEWEPKLSGFELSLKNTVARRHRLVLTHDIVKNVYLDPKYKKTGGLTHKSDVYSFGVVLFEALCGHELGEGLLSQLTKSHLDDMIDPHLKSQMDTESLKIFSDIAFCCIQEERADRPYIDQVVKGLEKALKLQSIYENPELPKNASDGASSSQFKWKNLEHLKIALNDIELATKNFSDKYCIGSGAFGSDHMILVYELASKGSLEDDLGNRDQEKQKIIHRDIKSANILLGDNWVAKIADFGLSIFHPADQDVSTFNASTIAGTPTYLDPDYENSMSGKINKKSDIYSFGVVLFAILTGRVAYDRIFTDIDEMGIAPIARHRFEKRTLKEIVDHKIKEETDENVFSLSKGPNEESLDIFTKIAFRCVAMTQVERPSIDVVINELKKALYCQPTNPSETTLLGSPESAEVNLRSHKGINFLLVIFEPLSSTLENMSMK
ncbi:kinase-like domain, phloem protein 2-like protein [Tanacetum coccineum]